MDTRIPSTPNLSASTSTARATPTQPKVPFAEVMGQTAVLGAETAMRALPGGPLMAAAVRGGVAPAMGAGTGAAIPPAPMQTMSQPLSGSYSATRPVADIGNARAAAPAGMSAAANGGAAAAEGPGAVAPSGGSSSAMNIDGALAQSQEMNLYYLRIQEQVNAENRSFTTMSNVMKAEHETVKTAIGNIR